MQDSTFSHNGLFKDDHFRRHSLAQSHFRLKVVPLLKLQYFDSLCILVSSGFVRVSDFEVQLLQKEFEIVGQCGNLEHYLERLFQILLFFLVEKRGLL